MRRNEQAEKQKHGIAYDTSSPLEEGAGWMCLEEAPFYAAVSMTTVKTLLRIVISSEARNLCHSRSHGQ